MSIRAPGFPVIACAAVLLVAAAVAVVDYQRTEDRVPPVPPLCPSSASDDCDNARNALFGPRLDRIRELESDYRRRAWLYALVVVAAAAGATGLALRDASRTDRGRIFANLGVAGVLLGLATAGLLSIGHTESIDKPFLPAFFPSLAMLAGAAIGGGFTRLQTGKAVTTAAPLPAWRRNAHRLALAGLAFTGATILLAWIFIDYQPGCGGSETEDAPGWTDVLAYCALGTSIAAGAFALVALSARRWFVALLCLVINPAALVFMAASTCAFY